MNHVYNYESLKIFNGKNIQKYIGHMFLLVIWDTVKYVCSVRSYNSDAFGIDDD